jgi:hypothetical protein
MNAPPWATSILHKFYWLGLLLALTASLLAEGDRKVLPNGLSLSPPESFEFGALDSSRDFPFFALQTKDFEATLFVSLMPLNVARELQLLPQADIATIQEHADLNDPHFGKLEKLTIKIDSQEFSLIRAETPAPAGDAQYSYHQVVVCYGRTKEYYLWIMGTISSFSKKYPTGKDLDRLMKISEAISKSIRSIKLNEK